MNRGNLIIYDLDGIIISQTGEACGDVLEHNIPNGIPYILLPYGVMENKKAVSVDISKIPHEVVFEDFNNSVIENSLDFLKELKISQLNNQCELEITSGFELELSNGLKHYDFDRDTQLNMSALQGKITLYMVLGTPLQSVSWYATHEPCEEYSIADFLTLCNYGEEFKTALIEKCKNLKSQVRNCTTREELELIVW